MLYRLLADLTVAVHLGFVLFVLFGGLLALCWRHHRWLPWVHLPAAVWGALIEFAGWICPLTYLENDLRQRAGSAGYEGGFVEHYLIPILYPGALTRGIQVGLGIFVVVLNVVVYLLWWRSRRRHS